MEWIFKRDEKDGTWYECSNCYTQIFVGKGEETPCYCKFCEKEHEYND